ncbi:type II toxin-antitoxin system HicA family toxin [Nitrospira sp. Kam-Ns4a]
MSAKLPVVSGQDTIRAFQRLGYEVVRQRGSHVRLRHPHDPGRKPLTVAAHRSLKPGLLRKLIRDAQHEVEEFVRLL